MVLAAELGAVLHLPYHSPRRSSTLCMRINNSIEFGDLDINDFAVYRMGYTFRKLGMEWSTV